MSEQIELLDVLPTRIVIAFDGDTAGQEKSDEVALRVLDQTRRVGTVRLGGPAVWELEAELEHWRYMARLTPPGSVQFELVLLRGTAIKEELEHRKRLDYQKTKTPWDLTSYIEQVKQQADLLSVIGARCTETLTAKRNGKSVVLLCPFHQEKTPSFYITDNLYFCFGCGRGGDAIEFVRDWERLEFVQALFRLGDEFGLQRPEQRIVGVRLPGEKHLGR
jgi:DNA primase